MAMAQRENVFSAWMDPVPEKASASWVLPGWGSPIQVRTFDPTSCDLTLIEGSQRWAIESCLVPSSKGQAFVGHCGPVSVGDCVVFTQPHEFDEWQYIWFPQRVLAVEKVGGGMQLVTSVVDRIFAIPGAHCEESIESEFLNERSCTGTARRLLLQRFSLNVDCPMCGGRGRRIVVEDVVAAAFGDDIASPTAVFGDEPDYVCPRCEAAWKVDYYGTLALIDIGKNQYDDIPEWVFLALD